MIRMDRSEDRPAGARLSFTGAEHATFAEELLMNRRCRWYRSVADRIAAAAVHAQLAQTLLMAGEHVTRDYDVDALAYEWAQALVVRGPADTADVELAQMVTPGGS